MKTIILCGGFGTRLASIISDKPKPLAPIAGKPFLLHIIDWLVKNNQTDIVFSLHHKAKQIKNLIGDGRIYGIKASFCVEKEPLGTGGAIKLATKNMVKDKEEVLIINGDTLFEINLNKFIEFHRQNKSYASIALSHVLDVRQSGQVKIDSQSKIVKFVEKSTDDENQLQTGLVNGGIYLFSSDSIRDIQKLAYPFSIEKNFFSSQISKQRFFGYTTDVTHHDIGTPLGYRKTDKWLSGQEEIVIRSRAPLRVSFGGGGTDIPPFDKNTGGCVLNATINKYVYGVLRLRNDKEIRLISSDYRLSVVYKDAKHMSYDGHMDLIKGVIKRINIDYGFELQIRSEVPPQSGLGSSASLCVVVIGLFNHLLIEGKMTKTQIAELAYKIETDDLKNKGGRQDQYAAVYGGFNFFEFLGDNFVKVNPISLPKPILLELEKNLVLAYVGKREASGTKHRSNGITPAKKRLYLESIKNLGHESYQSLVRGDLNRFGHILEETWELKKSLAVTTSQHIDKIYAIAKKSGAIGGRVTGAGGGGHMIFYCQTGTEHEVAKSIESFGAKVIDFSFDYDGLQTWEI